MAMTMVVPLITAYLMNRANIQSVSFLVGWFSGRWSRRLLIVLELVLFVSTLQVAFAKVSPFVCMFRQFDALLCVQSYFVLIHLPMLPVPVVRMRVVIMDMGMTLA
jgi:hypothetical protein